MPAMPWFRVTFLLFVMAVSSGYRFRCYMFCVDQTSTQNDYIEQRDRCRDYAELKVDMALRNIPGYTDGKTKKTQLVALFNECMANNGWNIAGEQKPPATSAATTPVQPSPTTTNGTPATPAQAVAAPVVKDYEDKASLSRSADCAFARHAAANSSNAAARAKACDLECAQRLKAAPDAPRPAACPSDVNPNPEMARGHDKEEVE